MKLTKPRAIRWTRDEYYQMGKSNLFGARRVELIKGEIIEMSPQDSLHATGICTTDIALRKIFARGFVIRVQLPLSLGRDSDPELDLTVVQGSPRDYLQRHPGTALLIVEIADTSLEYDRGIKASLYAEAGIQDYWIVNLIDRCLEVYREPGKDTEQPHGQVYAPAKILSPEDSISPLAKPDAVLFVRDLLP